MEILPTRDLVWFVGLGPSVAQAFVSGMQLDPTNCVLPANRAMALLKKSQYGAAEADCTLALSIDPTYVKVCASCIII